MWVMFWEFFRGMLVGGGFLWILVEDFYININNGNHYHEDEELLNYI
jgi:hypothetical protein